MLVRGSRFGGRGCVMVAVVMAWGVWCAWGSGPEVARAEQPGNAGGMVGAGAETEDNAGGGVVAVVDGKAVKLSALRERLFEAVGGEILAEYVIDQQLEKRLASEKMPITRPMIDREKRIILESLADDANESARLLRVLRVRRGLGETRYAALLRRNAGLRALVFDQVKVTEVQVEQAFALRYGPRYASRLILVGTLAEAEAALAAVESAETFGEVAATHSLDVTREVGGKLPAISGADPEYPDAVRDALAAMGEGQVSPPIALDSGFAIVKLERKIPGKDVQLADVKEQLVREIQRRSERVLMEKLAGELIREANVVAMSEALKQGWDRQRATVAQP